MGAIRKILQKRRFQTGIIKAKKLWYLNRGEPIEYGAQRLRYIPGTRPVRAKYIDSPDATVRNDARQVQFFVERVRRGDFVLDIGGNVGQYAVLFSSLVTPSGKVITFEPESSHRGILCRNLQLNGFSDRVIVEDLALSDTTGTHAFFSRNDAMSSLVKSGLGTNANSPDVNERVVTTARLDDYLGMNKLHSPDWVKIDTEGAEINILRGARKLLHSRTSIVCELHPYAWEEFGTSFEELLELVRECDRTIEYLDPSLSIQDGAFYGAVLIQ
jgi:FkbM family methyltransferase